MCTSGERKINVQYLNCCLLSRSSDFRPSYAHLGELRAFALAATATVTEVMRKEIVEALEMTE